jgi:hypothetical protein
MAYAGERESDQGWEGRESIRDMVVVGERTP